ncbi:MAG: response regulator [Anaerolineae bacterium]|nr:response regulator [Anaerolineae bacterium]
MFVPCPIRILVADSDPLSTSDLRAQLSALGYHVVAEAVDGHQVVSFARQLLPDVAVLALDLPDMDGLETSKEIDRERLCPVVLLGEFGYSRRMQAACSLSVVYSCLIKPVKEQELASAVELALARFREVERLEREMMRAGRILDTRPALAPQIALSPAH